MSQAFLFAVSLKIGGFDSLFLDTVLQCCPTILGGFPTLMPTFLPISGIWQGRGQFFEKKQNKSCCFQNVFNFLAANFLLAAGIFCFFRQFSFCFQVFHFIPMSSVTLPQELIDAINNVGFWDSIPLWAVTLIGGLLITVLSFTMILTVYGKMFSLWMYAAIAPIPLSTFAGEPTSSVGKNFIRSYAGVCLQGVVIALSCIIFYAISSSPPAVDTGASVVTAVWTYVGELAFNLLVLVGAIKGCDRIVKEIMGL